MSEHDDAGNADDAFDEIVSNFEGSADASVEPDEVARLEQERNELVDTLQRMQADVENLRKRMMREQSVAIERASERLVEQLLPVLDNFELAMTNLEADEDGTLNADKVRKGIELVFADFLSVLEKSGLERIDAQGAPFDPNQHEAVMEEPGDGGEPTERRSLERTVQRDVPEQHEVDDEDVHPVLARVPDRVRRRGHEHERDEPDPVRPGAVRSADASAREVRERQAEDAEERGQRPHGRVTLAEPAHPDVQQQVVERGCPVDPQRRPEVAEGHPGNVDRERLVEPEVTAHREAEDHTDHHDPDDRGEGEGAPGRRIGARRGRGRRGRDGDHDAASLPIAARPTGAPAATRVVECGHDR